MDKEIETYKIVYGTVVTTYELYEDLESELQSLNDEVWAGTSADQCIINHVDKKVHCIGFDPGESYGLFGKPEKLKEYHNYEWVSYDG